MSSTPEIASSAMRFFERMVLSGPRAAPGPAATAPDLTPQQVRQLTSKFRPVALPTAAETRRSLAKFTRAARRDKLGRLGSWGCKGLPECVWRAMFAEYRAGSSCRQVAAIFGGTRQSVHEVFQNRGLALRPRHLRLLEKITCRGRAYTQGKNGYYRATTGDRMPLHHRLWVDARGAIPAGWQVTFINANPADLRLENMTCAPRAAVTRLHRARHRATRRPAA
jgi:hypothetical protein